MATPAPAAFDNSRQLHSVTLGELNHERSQLLTEIRTARFRVSELERESARLKGLIDSNKAARIAPGARLVPLVTSGPAARAISAPSADSLRDKLKSEKDPRERFRLQDQLDAILMLNP
jgi:hypothetical protein